MFLSRSVVISFVFLIFPVMTAVSEGSVVEWEESAQFDIRIDGNIDITARVFQPTSYAPYMILISGKLSTPALIDLSKKRVVKISAKGINEQGSFIKTSGIPKGSNGVAYKLSDGATVFTFEGKRVSIRVLPPLVGEVSQGVILAHSPDYKLRMEAYNTRRASITKLKAYGKSTQVVVMFATWCSTCKVVLPKILRVFQDAGNPNFNIVFYGIAQGGEEPREALQRYGHDYPAVIFYQNGRELDRIVGDPPGAMEDAFLAILK